MDQFIYLIVLLLLGYVFGKIAEVRHYKSIKEREARALNTPAVTYEDSIDSRTVASSSLVASSICVSVDYYKRFMSGFRMFFGGELRSYASLIDRGRREAILRMREQAPQADAFLNVRLETSSIAQGHGDQVACVEILAYATAIQFADEIRTETTNPNG